MKKKNKIITQILAIALFLSSSLINSHAYSDKNISIESIYTKKDSEWYAGRAEYKEFSISNNKDENVKIDRLYIKLKSSKNLGTNQILDINSKQFKELSQNSTLKLTYKGEVLFEDKLSNLLSENGIVLQKEIPLKSNGEEILELSVEMDEMMGNDAQSLENIFNIGVAYKIDTEIGIGGTTDNEDENINNNQNNIVNKLPQTGGIINSFTLLALGIIVISIGIILNKKSLQLKGDKSHE